MHEDAVLGKGTLSALEVYQGSVPTPQLPISGGLQNWYLQESALKLRCFGCEEIFFRIALSSAKALPFELSFSRSLRFCSRSLVMALA